LNNVADFSAMLDAEVPASWPPGEYDRGAQLYLLAEMQRAGITGDGWFVWYAIDTDERQRRTVVAAAGFFGPPSPDGTVELGYSVCPDWRRLGFATSIASALATHAAAQPGVTRIVAQTSDDNPASVAVLERAGFVSEPSPEPPPHRLFRWVGGTTAGHD
jgi:RimJ/RimL family protein N-acetyltransferase